MLIGNIDDAKKPYWVLLTPRNNQNTTVTESSNSDANMIIFSDPNDPRLGGFVGETLIPHNGHNDATYKLNSYITCNRFNGHLGDQKYYYKSAHIYQAGVNFTGSDCDNAIGFNGAPCLDSDGGDYDSDPANRFCTTWAIDVNRTATCSELAGHKALYHKHTTYSGPTGY